MLSRGFHCGKDRTDWRPRYQKTKFWHSTDCWTKLNWGLNWAKEGFCTHLKPLVKISVTTVLDCTRLEKKEKNSSTTKCKSVYNSLGEKAILTQEMNFSDNQTVAWDSSDFQSSYYKEAQWAQILRLALYILIAFVGVAGNVIVCLVINFQPQMHTIINYFVRNLTIADLSILLISFPFAIVKEQDPYHWPLGEFLCRCVFPLSDLFFGVSLWSITLIAVDRHHGHRAIVRGVLPKRGSTVFKSSRLMVVCVWILSFLIISVPQYVVIDFFDYRPDFNITDCTQRWPNEQDGDELRQVYFMSLTVFCYVLPLSKTIVVGTFHSISRKLRASSKFNRTIREDYGKIDEQRHRKRLRESKTPKQKSFLFQSL